MKRYQDKLKKAVEDEEGISALEDLLATDPDLANLFGTNTAGKVAARTALANPGGHLHARPQQFVGQEFPTFFHRKNNETSVQIELPRGELSRVSFLTDVRNNYFTRRKHHGDTTFTGTLHPTPTFHLFNGRLTFTCAADKNAVEGTQLSSTITITDTQGSGPFVLTITATIVPAREKTPSEKTVPPTPPAGQPSPSRPKVIEIEETPEFAPLTIQKNPETQRLELLLNKNSQYLTAAKDLRSPEEDLAVEFVFKYGLALTAMGLLDAISRTPQWNEDEAGCRERITETCTGMARVIVPLCLSLPKKLPKQK